MENDINIVPFAEKLHATYFKSLNESWLKQYFKIEPLDHQILNYPKKEIIDRGGYIFMMLRELEIIGTFAFFASSAIAFKSNTSNFGFPKDSAKNKRVLDFTALANSFGSSGSIKVVVIPKRGNVFAKRSNKMTTFTNTIIERRWASAAPFGSVFGGSCWDI